MGTLLAWSSRCLIFLSIKLQGLKVPKKIGMIQNLLTTALIDEGIASCRIIRRGYEIRSGL